MNENKRYSDLFIFINHENFRFLIYNLFGVRDQPLIILYLKHTLLLSNRVELMTLNKHSRILRLLDHQLLNNNDHLKKCYTTVHLN